MSGNRTLLLPAQARKIKKVRPGEISYTPGKWNFLTLNKFLYFKKKKRRKKFLNFIKRKLFLRFGKRKPRKKFLLIQETELSYVSGNRTSKRLPMLSEMELFYISGNGTFLYFGEGIFRTLTYLELEACSEFRYI